LSRLRLIYVLGVGRSGSTLLDLLLGRRRGVVGVGEFTNVTEWLRTGQLCSCGEPVASCEMWSEVRRGVAADTAAESVSFGSGKTGTLHAIFRALLSGKSFPAYADVAGLNRAYLDRVREVTDAEVVVDSSKDIRRACVLAASDLFDIRFLHLVRDPRGVMWSRLKTKRNSTDPRDGSKQARSCSATMRRWVGVNLVSLAFGVTRWRGRYCVVRYEDLATDPEATLRRVATWADLPVGEAAASTPHLIAGNLVKMRPIADIRLDDEWRRSLGWRGRVAYVAHGGPIVAALVARVARAGPPRLAVSD
jgi:hypothetical protein